MDEEVKGKCGKDEEWKDELEKRLQTDDQIVLLALENVKYELLSYLNKRKDITVSSKSQTLKKF